MTIQGRTAVFTRDERRAQNPAGHPPVVIGAALKVNDGTYLLGQILKRDVDGITMVRAAEGDTFCGVLDSTVDTTQQASGNVVIHGSVVVGNLVIGAAGAEVAPTQAALLKLQTEGIFPA
ncbi:MAG: hypothetical protein M0023_04440 [Desulfobacteraceae bacterium]|nr:hypothetical protein [Desulfobacteraceae bacterium]